MIEYSFCISVSELEEEGISRSLLGIYYSNAKALLEKNRLFVTLKGMLPKYPEDLIAYVTSLDFSIRRQHLIVKMCFYNEESEVSIINEGKLIEEKIVQGQDYKVRFISKGKFLTLYPSDNGWQKRNYILKD